MIPVYDMWWPLPIVGVLFAAGCLLVVGRALRLLRSRGQALAPFIARPLLNRSELRLAAILDSYAHARGLRLLAQVSYGALLQTSDRASYLKVNATRADFALADTQFQVRAVVELHGSGHFGASIDASLRARASDRVKETAVRSAGIAFLVVPSRYTHSDIWAALDAALHSSLGGSPGQMARDAS